MVGANDEQPRVAGDGVLRDHPGASLDVALVEVADLHAHGLLVGAFHPVDGVLDVEGHLGAGGDEAHRGGRVVLVGLHAVRQPHGDELPVVHPLGRKLSEAPGERRIHAPGNPQYEALGVGGGGIVDEELDPSLHLGRRVDLGADAHLKDDLLLKFAHAPSLGASLASTALDVTPDGYTKATLGWGDTDLLRMVRQ